MLPCIMYFCSCQAGYYMYTCWNPTLKCISMEHWIHILTCFCQCISSQMKSIFRSFLSYCFRSYLLVSIVMQSQLSTLAITACQLGNLFNLRLLNPGNRSDPDHIPFLPIYLCMIIQRTWSQSLINCASLRHMGILAITKLQARNIITLS